MKRRERDGYGCDKSKKRLLPVRRRNELQTTAIAQEISVDAKGAVRVELDGTDMLKNDQRKWH